MEEYLVFLWFVKIIFVVLHMMSILSIHCTIYFVDTLWLSRLSSLLMFLIAKLSIRIGLEKVCSFQICGFRCFHLEDLFMWSMRCSILVSKWQLDWQVKLWCFEFSVLVILVSGWLWCCVLLGSYSFSLCLLWRMCISNVLVLTMVCVDLHWISCIGECLWVDWLVCFIFHLNISFDVVHLEDVLVCGSF